MEGSGTRTLRIQDYARMVRRQWIWVALGLAVCVSVAFAVSRAQPRTYSASARLFVSLIPVGGVPVTPSDSVSLSQQLPTYVGLVDSPRVLTPVISQLGLHESESALASKVAATSEANTALMDVTATDPSPVRARVIANVVSRRFAQVIENLETAPGAPHPSVSVTVVRPAVTPSSPASPKTTLNLLIGAFVGLCVGIAIALWRARSDTTLRSPEDVFDASGLPLLGAIPRSASMGGAVNGAGKRSDAYRRVRTNLRLTDRAGAHRSVTITSSLRGEGKTATACHVAATIAELGLSVTLVDADLRQPAVADYLGIEPRPGLVELLTGGVPLADARCALPSYGHLAVLTAGMRGLDGTIENGRSASELIDSTEMRACLETLVRESDIVIVDAPPVIPVVDAAILAGMTDGVALVVAAGRTRRQDLRRALATLNSVDASVSGLVLNMVSPKHSYP